MLKANRNLDAVCLREVAESITLDFVLAMENHKLIALFELWIKTSIVPKYLAALQTKDEQAGELFLENLSPPDEIFACLGVVQTYELTDKNRDLLVKRFYAQCLLLERADFRLVTLVHDAKLAAFIDSIV